jgi:hypothetical protein
MAVLKKCYGEDFTGNTESRTLHAKFRIKRRRYNRVRLHLWMKLTIQNLKNSLENAQTAAFYTTRLHSKNNEAGDILNWLTGLRSAKTRTRVMFQSGTILSDGKHTASP